MVIERFGVYLVTLDPTVGAEMRKSRPCVAVSPDEMHRHLDTVIIAPLTTKRRGYPTRVPCIFAGRNGEIALDQIRAVDQSRLKKRIGKLDAATASTTSRRLVRMFR